MRACRPSQAALTLLEGATKHWPDRRRTSDGTCPSEAHHAANPASDHEPNAAGVSCAVDLSHDPPCDCATIADAIREARDPRIEYVIFNGRIFSSYPYLGTPAWTWRKASGHYHHMHISLNEGHLDDDSPWPGLEDDMPLDCMVYSATVHNLEEVGRLDELADEMDVRKAEAGYLVTAHVRKGEKAERYVTLLAELDADATSMEVPADSYKTLKVLRESSKPLHETSHAHMLAALDGLRTIRDTADRYL